MKKIFNFYVWVLGKMNGEYPCEVEAEGNRVFKQVWWIFYKEVK